MKSIFWVILAVSVALLGEAWYNRLEVSASIRTVKVRLDRNLYNIPASTTYGWINARIIMTDDANFQWVNGAPYIIMTATHPVPSLTNAPTVLPFGIIAGSSTHYAKGSAPSTPVVNGDCAFTITNDGTITENIQVTGSDFTGGITISLVSGAPGANEVKMVAVYSGLADPANGLVLTTSPQLWYSGLTESSTLMWDFKIELGTIPNESNEHTGMIILTAIAP